MSRRQILGLIVFLLLNTIFQVESVCHVTFPGDIITPAHFFNVTLMEGMWYNSAVWSIEKESAQPNFKCLSYNISSNDDTTQAKILERLVYIDKPEEVTELNHNVVIENLPLPAIWQLFEDGTILRSGRLVWLQTTYSDWALEHFCYQGSGYLRLWVRSAAFDLNAHTQGILNEVAKGYGFPMENLLMIDNTNCPVIEQ